MENECPTCLNMHENDTTNCSVCKKYFCSNCMLWDWKSQFISNKSTIYQGFVVKYDNQGRGKWYCLKCQDK